MLNLLTFNLTLSIILESGFTLYIGNLTVAMEVLSGCPLLTINYRHVEGL